MRKYMILTYILFFVGCQTIPDANKSTEIYVLEDPDPAGRNEIIQYFQFLATESTLEQMYEELPDIEQGFAGVLKQSEIELAFVAYPFLEYPIELVFLPYFVATPDFSFSVMADKTRFDFNDEKYVDYSNAVITIVDEKGMQVPIESVRSNYSSTGIFNVLIWKMPDVKTNIKYTVSIENVLVKQVMHKYVYYFNIVGNRPW